MVPPEPVTFFPGADASAIPEAPAVYLIHPKQGRPHLGRTNVLRRRITRLFSRWNLNDVAERVEYWPVGSRLEQWLVSYAVARRHFPEDYSTVLKLPKPSYVRLAGNNRFPRTHTTSRLAGAQSIFYGPFVSRAAADEFEAQFLDLFQLRRCQEDLAPSPDHPGCIYGEMRRCLRPCQCAVTDEEYSSEAKRVAAFLSGRGEAMIEGAASARDRASAELDFEEAARQHARMEKVIQIVRLSGELARDVSALHGVAITKSTEPKAVTLWFLRAGCWLDPRIFPLAPGIGAPLDRRLRELVQSLEAPDAGLPTRQEHLALLAKWYFSSWRDGEWLSIDDWDGVPYRKLVNAIHRVATGGSPVPL